MGQTAAEDVAQDAWVRAISGLGGFRGQSTLRTWLCGIVVNCCRERWRRDGVQYDGDIEAAAGSDPEAALDVRTALERLPPGYRTVIVLHDIHGHTHLEIAGMLGIQEGTSKSQLARARRSMRELLKGETCVD